MNPSALPWTLTFDVPGSGVGLVVLSRPLSSAHPPGISDCNLCEAAYPWSGACISFQCGALEVHDLFA